MIIMIDELFDKFNGAFAENTERAYRADFEIFAQWCRTNDYDPYNTTGEQYAEFIEFEAETKTTATIRRRIGSLASIFKLLQINDPTKHPDAILALKRLHRQKGRQQKQAEPLTEHVLLQLLKACSDDIVGQRDRILLKLGYETMRRRSELCQFKFEDLLQLPNGKYAIRLNFSKTDQFGKGKIVPISEELYQDLEAWKDQVGEGYILRSISRYKNPNQSLSPASINRILKRLQNKSSLHLNSELSGHSFRVGKALDLLMNGESLEKIMLRGGWAAESTAMRYLREWNFE